MKRIKMILAAVLMVLAVTLAIPTAAAAAPEGSTTISIIHTNDIHGRFEPSNTAMGMDRMAAIFSSFSNAILVDAGDVVHGTPFVIVEQGQNAIELMNLAGYSFLAPGNHEFNYGINRLLELESMAEFGFLAANLTWAATGESVFTEYEIVEIGGVKVGFFGLVTPDTPIRTLPTGVIGLDFGDPVPAAQRAVAALKAQGAEVIVAIAHLGLDEEYSSTKVALAVPEIDVLIDGHCHTTLPEGRVVGEVLIAQAGDHGRFVGVVEIVVANGEVYSVSASLIDFEEAQEFEPDAAVAGRMTAMRAELDAELGSIIVGYNPTFLSGDRAILRTQEAPLGNLLADSQRWAMGVDFAIQNGGGIRTDLPQGNVNMLNIIDILPFFNYSVALEITPAVLWEAMEFGLSVDGQNGGFPQISGFSVAYDPEAPPLSRIISITTDAGVALSPYDNTTIYTITMNNFLAVGGDGYAMFIGLPMIAEGDITANNLIEYMAVVDFNRVGVEGRIEAVPGYFSEPGEDWGDWDDWFDLDWDDWYDYDDVFWFPYDLMDSPVPGEVFYYTAVQGETLWTIAFNFYGSVQADVTSRIWRANAVYLNASRGVVSPGTVLALPPQGRRDPLTRTNLDWDFVSLYLVEAGDTLASLADDFYGDASLWTILYEANADRVSNPNRIYEGQWLVVPY